MLIFLLITAVVICLFWWVKTSNDIKRKDINVGESMSGIEVSLVKRYDLLTKMLDVAKGYAAHEKALFEEVINLRQGMSINELNGASEKMDKLAQGINFVAESYPQLRSAEVFVELQRGIQDAEDHLQAARRLYNSNVAAYNTAIIMFPASIVAGTMGCVAKQLFIAEEHKKSDVKMDF